MARKNEVARNTEDRAEEVWVAGKDLARSLWRLGLTITSAPIRLLPEETQRHLQAAGREAVQAGIALNRGALNAVEEALSDARGRLDELEEKIIEAG